MPRIRTPGLSVIITSHRRRGPQWRSQSRRWQNWHGSSKLAHALKPASNGARARRGWTSTRCVPGKAGIIIWRYMALSLMAVWFLIGETHRGQELTPALTLPQVRYGLSLLLLEVFRTPGIDDICRQVQRQLLRNELARFYHHRTRKCLPPRK